jgi:hypothetical protein
MHATPDLDLTGTDWCGHVDRDVVDPTTACCVAVLSHVRAHHELRRIKRTLNRVDDCLRAGRVKGGDQFQLLVFGNGVDLRHVVGDSTLGFKSRRGYAELIVLRSDLALLKGCFYFLDLVGVVAQLDLQVNERLASVDLILQRLQ